MTECSVYSDSRHPTLRHLEQIPWVLRTDRKKQAIGFVPARELKPKDWHVLDEDDWS